MTLEQWMGINDLDQFSYKSVSLFYFFICILPFTFSGWLLLMSSRKKASTHVCTKHGNVLAKASGRFQHLLEYVLLINSIVYKLV